MLARALTQAPYSTDLELPPEILQPLCNTEERRTDDHFKLLPNLDAARQANARERTGLFCRRSTNIPDCHLFTGFTQTFGGVLHKIQLNKHSFMAQTRRRCKQPPGLLIVEDSGKNHQVTHC